MAYRSSKRVEEWKDFKNTVKNMKQLFFDNKIQEIMSKNQRPWNLINWIKKRKLPAIEAI